MPPVETTETPAAIPGTAETVPHGAFARRNLILAVMCLALLMVVAACRCSPTPCRTSPPTSAPASRSSSGSSTPTRSTLAALLLPAGALGDRYGRRGALIAGSRHLRRRRRCSRAVADSAGQLIALRALMGIGAALIMPGTLSTITSVFPPEERAKAVGIWAGFAGAGGTLGMLASGALLEQFSWGSIFVVTAVLASSRSSA